MKLLKLLLILLIVTVWSCITDDKTNQGTVTLDASGLSDDKLPINKEAIFTATVTDYTGNVADLTYQWKLDAEKGELFDGTNTLPNPSIAGGTMRFIGRENGDERLRVDVLDKNNAVIGSASVDFTIIPSIDPPVNLGCFDQPKIIYQRGNSSKYVCNFDGSDPEYLGVGGVAVAISPNGQWIAYTRYDNALRGDYLYLRNCFTAETIMIPGGTGQDFTPEFSNDSKIIYFLRAEPSYPMNNQSHQPTNIASYNIETREYDFLTSLHQSDESVRSFTVSKVSNEIAIVWGKWRPTQGDQLMLSILNPLSGLITDVLRFSVAIPNSGIDWSPNGEDIIFSGGSVALAGRGIFRVNLVDGVGEKLIFSDPSPQSLPPFFPHYYAGGTRIAWSGQENGQNNSNIWTIDANGNDLQQLTSDSANETVKGVLGN